MQLEGKKVLVTGASRGIGYAIAKRFLEEGARVVITGRNPETLTNAAGTLGGNRVYPLVWDTGDIDVREEKVAEVYRLLGGLDVLVNNAGILRREDYGGILGVTPESWDETMNINLRGTFFLTQAVVRRWVEDGCGGRIVNIDSNCAYRALDHAYAASKWAIRGLTMGMGKSLAPRGIYVNAVAPGCTTTSILGFTDGEMHRDSSPVGRHAFPDEIASVCLFLASGQSGTMVGQTLVVDGGETLLLASDRS